MPNNSESDMVFVFHCFDRIVTNGYLEHLARPGQVVHVFREILGIRAITKLPDSGAETQPVHAPLLAMAGNLTVKFSAGPAPHHQSAW